MVRGKQLKCIVVALALVSGAAMVVGFDGCNKKPTGATSTSPTVKTETTTGAGNESKDSTSEVKAAPGKMLVTLYFSDSNAEKLVAEKREIPKTPAVAAAIIRELIKGPRDAGLYPTLPHQLKLLGVTVRGRIAVVNVSDARRAGYGGTAAEMMMVYSIVNSLTELPNVKSVRFLVDGKKRDVLLDAFDIADPVQRDERLIRK